MSKDGWIGVDLDGTLAHHDGFQGMDHIGEPIPLMVNRVKEWLANGLEVKIMTARISEPTGTHNIPEIYELIQDWCVQHIGVSLPVTCRKDYRMVELWDDRAVRVIKNTGRVG